MDYFYTAMHRRSRGTTWPIFAPALTQGGVKSISAPNTPCTETDSFGTLQENVAQCELRCQFHVIRSEWNIALSLQFTCYL